MSANLTNRAKPPGWLGGLSVAEYNREVIRRKLLNGECLKLGDRLIHRGYVLHLQARYLALQAQYFFFKGKLIFKPVWLPLYVRWFQFRRHSTETGAEVKTEKS